MLTPEKSEMVATGDPDNTEADNPLFPTTTQQMAETIQWCVNKPSGLPKQVRASEDNELKSNNFLEPRQVTLVKILNPN